TATGKSLGNTWHPATSTTTASPAASIARRVFIIESRQARRPDASSGPMAGVIFDKEHGCAHRSASVTITRDCDLHGGSLLAIACLCNTGQSLAPRRSGLCAVAGQLAMEPALRQRPFALDSRRRFPDCGSGLLDRQAAKEAQLDDASLIGI